MLLTTYDIFITHAWRNHADWTRCGELLDGWRELSWRNFSVPWHDPAMDPNKPVGAAFIETWLESQIVPVHAVIALDSVHAVRSARQWVDHEIRLAWKHNKPVFGLPAEGQDDVSAELKALVDQVIPWHPETIIACIDKALEGQRTKT